MCRLILFLLRVLLIHSRAALDLGSGVEQPFDCFVIQNRQAVQSMGRSMDWTTKVNILNGLSFCGTLTGRRSGHTPLPFCFQHAQLFEALYIRRNHVILLHIKPSLLPDFVYMSTRAACLPQITFSNCILCKTW